MVQPKYRPDGWLGICIAGLHYCDFVGKHSFEQGFENLIKQLARILKPDQTESICETDFVDKVSNENESNEVRNSHISEWTNSDVQEWLTEIGIEKINWKRHYTGMELEFLKSVSKVPGDVFYQICKNELEISDLKDLRIFYEKLKTL